VIDCDVSTVQQADRLLARGRTVRLGALGFARTPILTRAHTALNQTR